jgi:anaphase-promoting complex subunit 5
VSAKLAGLKSPGGGNPDLALRLHFLILKARIFTAAKRAAKGFSIALRATSTAGRHLLIPVLLEGLAVLSNILSELSEFETARDLLASAIPHALEAQNTALVARMYVTMGEVCVGFAGHRCPEGSRERSRSMRQAMDVVELGMAAYERCEDYQGLLDCLLMKATIAGWSGDDGVVKQTEARYYTLLAEHDKEAAA